jgi:hypothetical protein
LGQKAALRITAKLAVDDRFGSFTTDAFSTRADAKGPAHSLGHLQTLASQQNASLFDHRRAEAMSAESPLERRLPWVHAVLEISEILPYRFRRLATGSRRVDRGFYQMHSGNIARTIRKNCPRNDPNDELSADDDGQERVLIA